MKILDNTKTLSVLDADTSNGLGQIQPLSCIVSEELNGIYECEFTVPTTDKHYSDLKTSGLIKVTVGDGSEQIFRIYSISEPINFVVEVKAQHITYDLSKIPVKPFTATGAVNVKNQMLANIIGSYDFTMSTDITNTTSTFKLDIPRSFRECLGGYEGSILDVFRPEYKWDNLEVKMLARRGADNNVRISYGKNLTDFRQEQNNESVYDAVYGYAVVDDVCYEASSIYNKTGATVPRVLRVDFSNKYESGDVPTGAELLAYATTYATDNDIEVPSVNIKISFIPLWQTDEYKSILQIERVKLGDTVHVYFEKLGVTASARVIKTVWNSLTEKYDSVELGDARANLNTVINQAVDDGVSVALEDLDVDVGWLDDKITNMAELIANGMGLHITIDSAGRIYLHNADTLAGSQYQYEITSSGFMLSDDYGVTWNSGWDISGNAVTNSLSTITLKALEIYGSYIEGSQILFGDHNNKYILAQVYNDGVDDVGVTFDGSGYVRFQPQEQFLVNNIDSYDNILNQFVLGSKGTNNQAYVALKNYDYTNQQLANAINMDAHLTNTQFQYDYNTMQLENYETTTGTSILGNSINLTARAAYNGIQMTNYVLGSGTSMANRFTAYTQTGSKTIGLNNYGIENGYTYSANAVQLNVNDSASRDSISIENMKYGSQSYANRIYMVGMPLSSNQSNYMELSNYDVDGTNVANRLYMSKSTNDNTIYLRVYRGGTEVGEIILNRASTGVVSLGMYIYNNNTYGYSRSNIEIKSDGSVNANGTHFYWNGSQKW